MFACLYALEYFAFGFLSALTPVMISRLYVPGANLSKALFRQSAHDFYCHSKYFFNLIDIFHTWRNTRQILFKYLCLKLNPYKHIEIKEMS